MENKKTAPFTKIFISHEDDEEIVYVASPICDCGECQQDLDLSIDKKCGQLVLQVFANFNKFDLDGCEANGFLSRLAFRAWKRLSLAGEMLFTGKVSVSHWFMFSNEKSVADYITALQSGVDKLKALNEQRRNAQE